MMLQNNEPLLDVQNLKKYFPVTGSFGRLGGIKGQVKAVNDVSFQLYAGETYGLVGESGCGKSTTGRTVLRLTEPTDGKVFYKSRIFLNSLKGKFAVCERTCKWCSRIRYSSLNPRKRIGQTIEEPLVIHRIGNGNERRESRVFEI